MASLSYLLSSILLVVVFVGATRAVRLGREDCGGEKKMESPPRLGLGTINIVLFME